MRRRSSISKAQSTARLTAKSEPCNAWAAPCLCSSHPAVAPKGSKGLSHTLALSWPVSEKEDEECDVCEKPEE
eukprot:2963497-Pleurochrysis_carterae.AAC.1